MQLSQTPRLDTQISLKPRLDVRWVQGGSSSGPGRPVYSLGELALLKHLRKARPGKAGCPGPPSTSTPHGLEESSSPALFLIEPESCQTCGLISCRFNTGWHTWCLYPWAEGEQGKNVQGTMWKHFDDLEEQLFQEQLLPRLPKSESADLPANAKSNFPSSDERGSAVRLRHCCTLCPECEWCLIGKLPNKKRKSTLSSALHCFRWT